jgi:hypothetical protein
MDTARKIIEEYVSAGVAFNGTASELDSAAHSQLEAFLARWPQARSSITTERVARDETPSRLYEIRVDEWILFDEETFPDSPRRPMPASPAQPCRR